MVGVRPCVKHVLLGLLYVCRYTPIPCWSSAGGLRCAPQLDYVGDRHSPLVVKAANRVEVQSQTVAPPIEEKVGILRYLPSPRTRPRHLNLNVSVEKAFKSSTLLSIGKLLIMLISSWEKPDWGIMLSYCYSSELQLQLWSAPLFLPSWERNPTNCFV